MSCVVLQPNNRRMIACHECDLLQHEVALPVGGVARCRRCSGLLYRNHPRGLERALAYTLGALVLFAISNTFPIVGLEVNGELIQTTLLGTASKLYRDGMWLVAALVLFTTLLAPLAHLLAMLYVLLPLRFGRLPRSPENVIRLLTEVRHWGMVEVFVLGVLVSLVKLADLAKIVPGVALWSFGGLMILFTAASTAFDPRQIWLKLENAS
jgi:paraquat-inducible protein A